MKLIKCPWCGREVKISKSGRLLSHLNFGGIKCVGIGSLKEQVEFLNKNKQH
jgi:hypothetical protein